MNSQDFLHEYIEEAKEHLQELEESLLILEREGPNKREISRIFRAAHSIKGASAYMGFEQLASLTHELESFMSKVQNDSLPVTQGVISMMLECVDSISTALKHLHEHGNEPQIPASLLESLQALRSSTGLEVPPQEELQRTGTELDCEISFTAFAPDAQSGEAVPGESTDEQGIAEIGDLATSPQLFARKDNIIEEEDQELFAIFLNSFQEQFSKLSHFSRSCEGRPPSDKDAQQYLDLIHKLVSSSQYMDYEQVVGRLKELEAAILSATEEGGEKGERIAEIIEEYGKLFEQILPGLYLFSAVPAPLDQTEIYRLEEVIQEEDEELLAIFTDSLNQQLRDLLSLTPPTPDIALATEQFNNACEILKKIISSSQYMGYEPIVDAMTAWDEALSEAYQNGLLSGARHVELFVHHSQLLRKLLPRLAIPEPAPFSAHADPYEDLDRAVDASFDELESLPLPARGEAEDIPETLAAASSQDQETRRGDSSPRHIEPEEDTSRKARNAGLIEDAHSAATLRVDAQKVDQLLNQVGELVVTRSEFIQTAAFFRELLRELAAQGKLSKHELRALRTLSFRFNESTLSLGRVANDLQNSVMRVRMLPISFLFQRFPRVVRDQALKLGKRVDLVVEGADTEIDKRVLEQMNDPLVQFLRNAIAHGIEEASERRRVGKPEVGTIRLAAYHEGDYVAIEVEDDGRGIDFGKLKGILQSRKGLNPEQLERLTDREIMYAIFLPGISTHGSVDGTAGRGVGLDVVKENLERMNGSVEVESEPGVGTRFTIRIPLTVAIIRALMVQGGDQSLAIPLSSVSEILRYDLDKIHTIEGFRVITLRGKTIPLVHLGQLLKISPRESLNGHKFIVIVTTSFREVGLVVDGLMGEREIVIKPIEDSTYDYEGFSGATILGDGTVSLILDVSALLRIMKNSLSQDPMDINPLAVKDDASNAHQRWA